MCNKRKVILFMIFYIIFKLIKSVNFGYTINYSKWFNIFICINLSSLLLLKLIKYFYYFIFILSYYFRYNSFN